MTAPRALRDPRQPVVQACGALSGVALWLASTTFLGWLIVRAIGRVMGR